MPNEETMKSMQQEKRIEYKVLASDPWKLFILLVVFN
jgi:mannosyltransferase OCH1-like enzyme